MTQRQRDLIATLLRERVATAPSDIDALTVEGASALIAALLRAPKRAQAQAQPAADAVACEGIYRAADGSVYRVVRSDAGRLYAKKLRASGRGFDYAAGAIRTLTAADRLTLTQAQAYGLEFGVCVVCGRELSDPASVQRGIGPVCAANRDLWVW